MKKVRIVMANGKEFIYDSYLNDVNVLTLMKQFSDGEFNILNKFITIVGEDQPVKIIINPNMISSMEEFVE